MDLVIVESPYAGDVEANVAYAKECVHDCLKRGEAPYASHLFFTQPGILDDTVPEERKLGIEAGLAWGNAAKRSVVYVDRGFSSGMVYGIQSALKARRPVELRALYRTVTLEDHSRVAQIAGQVQAEAHFDFAAFFDNKARWSKETFGPGDRYTGVCAHIRKELDEVETDPTDVSEWVDIVLLAMDGAWRSARVSGKEFLAALIEKDSLNRSRKWPDWRGLSPNEVSEHIE